MSSNELYLSTPETKFIHDLGSPLSTVVIIVATLLDQLRERGEGFAGEIEQLETINQLLERVSSMMSERRSVILGAKK